MRPPPRYSCVAGVLAHLLIHARRAGDGLYGGRGLYTLWAGLMALACLVFLLTIEKGARLWREREEEE